MKKAKTKEQYLTNIDIFVQDLLKVNTDELSRSYILGAADDVSKSNNLSQIKYACHEFERMYLEGDISRYREVMNKIATDGYPYGSVLDDMESIINEIKMTKKIRNIKQYKAALFFVEINYSNDNLKDDIELINQMLVEFEDSRNKKREHS